MPKLACLIPTRLNSRRLPNKALLKLNNFTLIENVYFNTLNSFNTSSIPVDIFVTTDSPEIVQVLESSSIPYLLTTSAPVNGTERIAEAYTKHSLNYDYIVDVQGDEPFINQNIISLVTSELFKYLPSQEVVILPHQLISDSEALSESVVKIVVNNSGFVQYLSRSLIPYCHSPMPSYPNVFKKHLSVIGFTRASLLHYRKLFSSYLESVEDIELLRALENMIPIYSPHSKDSTFSIDTEADLLRARSLLAKL